MANKPVIYLAFANDRVDHAQYLRNLSKELDGVRKALYLAEQMELCEVVERANVTIDQIVNVFQDSRYRDRIAIFHYGGHAHGYQLLLETLDEKNVAAEAGGLVPFFARQQSLKLVFLNGCASRPHALELIDAGIPAVVGTAEPISDQIATQLSIRFYKGLAEGLPLDRAWAEAEDEVKMSTRKGDYRDMVMNFEEWEQSGEFRELPWELHIRSGAEEVKEWSLPIACGNPLFGLPDLPKDIQPQEEPFLFFKRYERKDAAVFFGRSSYVRELYNRITDLEAPPLILLYGQSGVGKSSMLDAGLRPRLEHAHEVVYVRRQPDLGLLASLETALKDTLNKDLPHTEHEEKAVDHSQKVTESLSPSLQKLIAELDEKLKALEDKANPEDRIYLEQLKAMQKHGEGMIADIQKKQSKQQVNQQSRQDKLKRVLDTASLHYQWLQIEAKFNQPFIIILDQVEEVFTRPAENQKELEEFLALIREVFNKPNLLPEGNLILSYRKEYHPEIEKACKTFAIPRSQVFLERLNRLDIMEVVKGLTLSDQLRNWYHLTVDEHLPGTIADELLSDRDSPVAPILQILVTKMWNKAKAENPAAPHFSTRLYHELKEEGILLDEFFDQQIEQLSMTMPEVVESGLLFDLLNYHTTPLGTADSRRLEDIRQYYNHRQEEIDEIIRQCKELYLLTDAGDKVSLSHDTLAPLVQKAFRDSDAPGQRAYRILDNKMLDFDPANQSTTLDPVDLELVEKGENGMRTWELRERELVRLSRIRREREKRASTIRWALFALGMTIIAGLGIYSMFKKQEADEQRREASLQRDTAVYQKYLADSNRLVAEYQEFVADSNRQVAEFQRNVADSNRQVAIYEKNNAIRQEQIARAEALVNKTQFLITSDNPNALNTAIEAWNTLASDATYGALLGAYHHSPVPKTLDNFNERVVSLAVAPNAKFVAAGSWDNSVKTYNALGEPMATFTGHNARINALALSNTHLASVAEDKALLIYPITNPKEEIRVPLENAAQWVQFLPDGKSLVVLQKEELLRFSLQGNPLDNKISFQEMPTAISLSPDGRFLGLAYLDGKIELRQSDSGLITNTAAGHATRINGLGYSSDGSKIFTVANDSTAIIWNGDLKEPVFLKGHSRRVLNATFLDRDQYLATASADKTIRIWDTQTGTQLLTLKGHGDEINAVQALGEGQSLFSISSDRTLRKWSLQGRHQETLVHQGPITAAAFLRQNNQIHIGTEKGAIRWWNVKEMLRNANGPSLKGNLLSIVTAPDRKSSVSISRRGQVIHWPAFGQPGRLLEASDGKLRRPEAVCISNKWIVVGADRDKKAFIWNKNGSFHKALSHNGKSVDLVAISPNEQQLLTLNNDSKTAKYWIIATGTTRNEFTLPMSIKAIAYWSNNQVLLAGEDGLIHCYNALNGQLQWKGLDHRGTIRTMKLAPNKQYLLTASKNQWRLWNLNTSSEIYNHTGHESTVNAIDFSADGRYILSASSDGTVKRWLIDPSGIKNSIRD